MTNQEPKPSIQGLQKILVIGGGAAGFFGAIQAKRQNPDAEVRIIEATGRLLTKVKISGGGRCNVTHACFDPRALSQFYPRGAKELRSAFSRFQPLNTISWFEQEGVKLKTEGDGRMFPTTDSSQTIIDCLMNAATRSGVIIQTKSLVREIRSTGDGFRVNLHGTEPIEAHKILLATGSSPQGHEIAQSLGHTLVSAVPSLFTFEINDPLLQDLPGQSIPEVRLKLRINPHSSTSNPAPKPSKKKLEFVESGPLLITHWGISGPAVLKLSARAARELFAASYQTSLSLNAWLPWNRESLFEHLRKIKVDPSRQHTTAAELRPDPLSKRLFARYLELAKLPPDQKLQEVPQSALRTLAELLTDYPLQITGKGVFKEEFVTCGGVKLAEVDFRTMQSKVCPGLYFAGEVLDIDGLTGGFNFQNAWTTSYIAGSHMGQSQQVGHDEF